MKCSDCERIVRMRHLTPIGEDWNLVWLCDRCYKKKYGKIPERTKETYKKAGKSPVKKRAD